MINPTETVIVVKPIGIWKNVNQTISKIRFQEKQAVCDYGTVMGECQNSYRIIHENEKPTDTSNTPLFLITNKTLHIFHKNST